MTISHFITVHFITLAWWSFILAQVPISPNSVFDASLVPETCLECPPFAIVIPGFDSAS